MAVDGLEGRVHVGHLHEFSAVGLYLRHPKRVGGAHHDHLRTRADALCGKSDGDGMVASAHRCDPPLARRSIEGKRMKQGAAHLKGARQLKHLQL